MAKLTNDSLDMAKLLKGKILINMNHLQISFGLLSLIGGIKRLIRWGQEEGEVRVRRIEKLWVTTDGRHRQAKGGSQPGVKIPIRNLVA